MEPASFVSNLSKELGMKGPATIFDLILSYISESYRHYHILPESQLAGIDMVLSILEEISGQYIQKFEKVPVLILDGVDLLAKYDPEMCCHLLTHAKVLANKKTLKVVLVSIEGAIMPLLDKVSAINRALIYEVGDIKEMKCSLSLVFQTLRH